jgi:hypothetical protein
MSARTELDRLAAARPPALNHTEWIVSPSAEDAILRQILSTTQVAADRRPPASRPPASRPPASRPPASRPPASRHPASRHPAGRSRSRRPLIGLIAAAAVIAVAGGGALARSALAHPSAPGRPGSGHRISRPDRLPADQVMAGLVERAVDAACRTDILYVRTVYAAGTTVGGITVMASWTKGVSDREKLFGTGGTMLDDVSAVISHRMRVRRFVDYSSRTWQTDSIALSQYGAGGPPGQRIGQILAPHSLRPKAYVRVRGTGSPDIPSRTITAVTVHGRRMILVTFSYPRPLPGNGGPDFVPLLGSTEMLPAGPGRRNSVIAEQIWISATSYLPVRAVFTGAGGRVLGTETYAWLSPSAKNRAVLSPAPVPAGFRLTAELAH